MQQIMEMASSLGLAAQPEAAMDGTPNAEAVKWVSNILSQTEEKDQRQQSLVRALLPYLTPKRRLRLERAMKISHLSRLAGTALQNNQAVFALREEEKHDV